MDRALNWDIYVSKYYTVRLELTEADNSAQIFNILSTLPASLTDVDTLLKVHS